MYLKDKLKNRVSAGLSSTGPFWKIVLFLERMPVLLKRRSYKNKAYCRKNKDLRGGTLVNFVQLWYYERTECQGTN